MRILFIVLFLFLFPILNTWVLAAQEKDSSYSYIYKTKNLENLQPDDLFKYYNLSNNKRTCWFYTSLTGAIAAGAGYYLVTVTWATFWGMTFFIGSGVAIIGIPNTAVWNSRYKRSSEVLKSASSTGGFSINPGLLPSFSSNRIPGITLKFSF